MRLASSPASIRARLYLFERDMQALAAAGVELDIFPIYPLDRTLWRYSLGSWARPSCRGPVCTTSACCRVSRARARADARARNGGPGGRGGGDRGAAVRRGAAREEPVRPAEGVGLGARNGGGYDHVLAYWGNYAATCAYLFHRLIDGRSVFDLVARRTDLYLRPVYLAEKLRYADTVITCCEFNRGYLAEHYARTAPGIAERVHVCYHGVDWRSSRTGRRRGHRGASSASGAW